MKQEGQSGGVGESKALNFWAEQKRKVEGNGNKSQRGAARTREKLEPTKPKELVCTLKITVLLGTVLSSVGKRKRRWR